VDFRILGPLEVLDGDDLVEISAARHRAMLTALLLRVNQVVLADQLVDQLWGLGAPNAARTTIQTYVHRLRRMLHRPDGRSRDTVTLQTRSGGYVLEMDPNLLDLHRFERLVAKARCAIADGRSRDGAESYEEALALWRGPALADIASAALRIEACRLDEQRMRVLEERNAWRLRLGDHEDLVGELTAMVAAHPLREEMVGQLMMALYRSGRQAEALQTYRSTRAVLVEELGLEPNARLQQLERAILTADPSVQAPRREEASRSRTDHGSLRQLLPPASESNGSAATLASAHAMLDPARETEVTAIAIVVVTGKPGVGKMALALQLAQQVRSYFPDVQLYADQPAIGAPDRESAAEVSNGKPPPILGVEPPIP
jgi:DNA-binding SARP family transcriptional activator